MSPGPPLRPQPRRTHDLNMRGGRPWYPTMTGLWPSGTGSRNAKAQQWVAQVSSQPRPSFPRSITNDIEMTLMILMRTVLNHDKTDTMIT